MNASVVEQLVNGLPSLDDTRRAKLAAILSTARTPQADAADRAA